MRRRGELLERPFAHAYETGGMRRIHLRHHENIAKRLLVHIAGFNLGLRMRKRFGKDVLIHGSVKSYCAIVIRRSGADVL